MAISNSYLRLPEGSWYGHSYVPEYVHSFGGDLRLQRDSITTEKRLRPGQAQGSEPQTTSGKVWTWRIQPAMAMDHRRSFQETERSSSGVYIIWILTMYTL